MRRLMHDWARNPVPRPRVSMTVASGRVAVASAMVVRTTLLVGSQGDSYDNALAETNKGFYKAKLIHHKAPWKTMDSLELVTLAWV